MPGRPVRLAVASRHEIVARGLTTMLAAHDDRVLIVDGEVDVVLHDGVGGADPKMMERLASRDGVAVLVLADVLPDGSPSRQPLMPGAVAWVPLGASAEEIVALVEAAAAGELSRPEPPDSNDGRGLSAREVEVLGLIALGLTNQEVADRMYISINSVKTYIRSGYRKIGVRSRSQAVAWCIRHGVRPQALDA